MRKFLILFGILLLTCMSSFAAKVPDNVKAYIDTNVPGTDIRFDGVVIMPNNVIYLPLYPSLFSDITTLKIKETYPSNQTLSQYPDVVIFNNDFVLLKVLTDGDGHRTVKHFSNPPLQVRTGLLPQDMLVPSGLIIPDNIKGIIGNLKIDTKGEDLIKQTTKESFEEFLSTSGNNNQTLIPQLKDKILFATTNYSKNIQVLEPAKATPIYALAQQSIPVDVEPVLGGKFLLVTSYERPFLDVVSVADSRFIKQIGLGTFPEEIVLDEAANKAYITAPRASMIFVVDLKTMSLVQKIRVNGYCEKLLLAGDKMFYYDKLKANIWAIETGNEYTLRNIGKFPNVSAFAYNNNKLYISSRTKSRIAVVDYNSLGLESEFTTVNKPLSILPYGKTLYVLGGQNNVIQKINADTGKVIENINLGTGGFSSGLNRISGTNYAVVSDIKKNLYTIFDLATGKVIKTYSINVPIKDIKITNRIKLFN